VPQRGEMINLNLVSSVLEVRYLAMECDMCWSVKGRLGGTTWMMVIGTDPIWCTLLRKTSERRSPILCTML
jgi:hypothetical protein